MTHNSQERTSQYFPDVESSGETARLQAQGRLLTKYSGGILPEFPLARFRHVIDIACGSGDWALEYAFQAPESKVVGIDISQKMIANALAQAQTQGLENASFLVMDATQPLAFPDASFDLINARAIAGMLPAKLWPTFMRECARIARPGAVIRLTETDNWGLTSCEAYEELNRLGYRACKLASLGFSPDGNTFGITNRLKWLLGLVGCQNIQAKSFYIDFSVGTEGHIPLFRNFEAYFLNAKDKFIQLGVISPERFDERYEQFKQEMLYSPDFCEISYFLTAWGEIPSESQPSQEGR